MRLQSRLLRSLSSRSYLHSHSSALVSSEKIKQEIQEILAMQVQLIAFEVKSAALTIEFKQGMNELKASKKKTDIQINELVAAQKNTDIQQKKTDYRLNKLIGYNSNRR